MSRPWKPRDRRALSPYLIVARGGEVIDFLRAAFGAATLRRIEREDGSVVHGEVRIGDTVVLLGAPEEGREWIPTPTHVRIAVPDVDEAYRRALEAGGVSVQAPEPMDPGTRRAAVRGPGGHTWWLVPGTAPDGE